MATNFIAVQCFQCSTMQVKQQKKSSNKWSCVVCNQKQSVRKVFAQSAMARDVRKFVQSFNMSRQLSDQKQLISEEVETFDSQSDSRKMKRNDWTEYVNEQDEYGGKFDEDEDIAQGDDGLEPMVVTEIPKALFKKPKVKDYSSDGYGYEKMLKPVFRDRRNAKRRNENSQDVQLTEFEQKICETISNKSDFAVGAQEVRSYEAPSDRAPKWNRFKAQIQDNVIDLANTEKPFVQHPTKGVKDSNSKWSDYMTQEDDENNRMIGAPIARSHHTTAAAKGPAPSKWSSFITEETDDDDDDSLESGRMRDLWDRINQQRSSYPLESLMNNERVEDDIHPDFL